VTIAIQLKSLAALPPKVPQKSVETRIAEALRLRTVDLNPPDEFSGSSSSHVLVTIFQLELFFVTSTEFRYSSFWRITLMTPGLDRGLKV